VVLVILLVASGMYLQTLLATRSLRRTTDESLKAARAAQIVLEALRNHPFEETYARFNADPFDDPDGKGTAPGDRFSVPGLRPTAADAFVGRIVFPSVVDETEEEKPFKKKKGVEPIVIGGLGFPGPEGFSRWVLSEGYADPAMGMPRDLNGDERTDALDHSEDYLRLPVFVRIAWRGPNGPRESRFYSILADYRSMDEKVEKEREKRRQDQEKQAHKRAKEEEKEEKERQKQAEKEAQEPR